MSLKRRDIEGIEQEPFKEPPFTNFFVGVLRFILKVPILKKRLRESIGGLSGRIFRHWENNEYEEATDVALFALEKYRNKKSKLLPFMLHHHWWRFVKHGVDSATKTESSEKRKKLINFANSGIEPFEGYDVAYSYLEFSRWEYVNKDYETAEKYANIASQADNTWAEPDFILGWYSLVLGSSDAEKHLSHAIEKDHRVLFRIVNNDICKQHPQIISNLKLKYSKAANDKSPNK